MFSELETRFCAWVGNAEVWGRVHAFFATISHANRLDVRYQKSRSRLLPGPPVSGGCGMETPSRL
jgi:hypothetical protein